jgi:hypothetical protein
MTDRSQRPSSTAQYKPGDVDALVSLFLSRVPG